MTDENKTKCTFLDLCQIAAEGVGIADIGHSDNTPPPREGETYWQAGIQRLFQSVEGAGLLLRDIEKKECTWVISCEGDLPSPEEAYTATIYPVCGGYFFFGGGHKSSWPVALLIAYASLIANYQIELVGVEK